MALLIPGVPGLLAAASRQAEKAIQTAFLNSYGPPATQMSDEVFLATVTPCVAQARESFSAAHAEFERTRRSGGLMLVFRGLPPEANAWRSPGVLMVEHSSVSLVEAREWMGSVRESKIG